VPIPHGLLRLHAAWPDLGVTLHVLLACSGSPYFHVLKTLTCYQCLAQAAAHSANTAEAAAGAEKLLAQHHNSIVQVVCTVHLPDSLSCQLLPAVCPTNASYSAAPSVAAAAATAAHLSIALTAAWQAPGMQPRPLRLKLLACCSRTYHPATAAATSSSCGLLHLSSCHRHDVIPPPSWGSLCTCSITAALTRPPECLSPGALRRD